MRGIKQYINIKGLDFEHFQSLLFNKPIIWSVIKYGHIDILWWMLKNMLRFPIEFVNEYAVNNYDKELFHRICLTLNDHVNQFIYNPEALEIGNVFLNKILNDKMNNMEIRDQVNNVIMSLLFQIQCANQSDSLMRTYYSIDFVETLFTTSQFRTSTCFTDMLYELIYSDKGYQHYPYLLLKSLNYLFNLFLRKQSLEFLQNNVLLDHLKSILFILFRYPHALDEDMINLYHLTINLLFRQTVQQNFITAILDLIFAAKESYPLHSNYFLEHPKLWQWLIEQI